MKQLQRLLIILSAALIILLTFIYFLDPYLALPVNLIWTAAVSISLLIEFYRSRQKLNPTVEDHAIRIIVAISTLSTIFLILFSTEFAFISGPIIKETPIPSPTSQILVGELPTPTLVPSSDKIISKMISDAVDHLERGQIGFNPPSEMNVEKTYEIDAVIARSFDEGARKELEIELKNTNVVPEIKEIKVSSEMKVELTSQNANDFKIVSLSDAQQAIGTVEHAQWKWYVTPLNGGEKILILKVSAIIELPGLTQKSTSLPVLERHINVRVTPLYMVQSAAENYWYWLVIAMSGSFGWFWIRKKTKQQTAERQTEPQNIYNINTKGGPYIAGDVSAGKDFVGRDKTERHSDES